MAECDCCELLSGVGLCANEYLKREIDGTLSGGEMKRLEIATVLAKPHKLCVFDEPEVAASICGAFLCWWISLRRFTARRTRN